MTEVTHAAIARNFVEARKEARGLQDYPGPVPESLAEGYAVQDAAMALLGESVGGWKVGRLPAPLVERYGAERLAGPIFASTIKPMSSDAMGLIFADGFGAAEAEFLLRVGQAPDPAKTRYSLNEAAALIDAVHIGVEIASSPFAGINRLGPAVTVSDFGNNNGLLIGPAINDWQSLAFAEEEITVRIDGATVGSGRASSFPDGPIGSVRFLLENLAQRKIPLRAGAWISSGAVTGVHEVVAGQQVIADFGSMGLLECRIVKQEAEQII
ncbi:2-keto-4-pentenoate hydratase [Sphingobium bisphenolivorans]|uniref:2-keto-4-pentenoate hydratase n=1 Tax=Sphingobium bisphenolivorans TaxID=1335760 RepID=UPI00039B16F2|nr:2-keto-4-pentenoate hydratase [Sphingobium bisphenolivorans]